MVNQRDPDKTLVGVWLESERLAMFEAICKKRELADKTAAFKTLVDEEYERVFGKTKVAEESPEYKTRKENDEKETNDSVDNVNP